MTPRTERDAAGVPSLTPRAKLWLEVEGRIGLSEWRVALLEAVEETGSLARAAERLAIPYRTAAYKLREIEDHLGVRLLTGQSGGAAGGGSRLTPAARDLIQRWRHFSAGLDDWVAARFAEAFGGEAPLTPDPSPRIGRGKDAKRGRVVQPAPAPAPFPVPRREPGATRSAGTARGDGEGEGYPR